jgi:hypothetical protein
MNVKMFVANVKRYRITVAEMNERRMYSLKRLVLSQTYPQKNEAGIAENKAIEVMIPRSTSDPPIVGDTTYNGMKTDSKPNAISWKKNPSRHIARARHQRRIKTFARKQSKVLSENNGRCQIFINP